MFTVLFDYKLASDSVNKCAPLKSLKPKDTPSKFELHRLAEENMALRQLINTDPSRTLQMMPAMSNGSIDSQSADRPLLDSTNSSRTALFTNTTLIRPIQPKTVIVSTSSIIRS
ncbi:hypothetical protein AHF37_08612 [Paragonimus kellicotti]|nr:hypothetical protein AHF37_08612 [Paragonimus kellicotti]